VAARAGYFSVCDVPTVVDLSDVLGGGLDDGALAAAGEAALPHLDPQADIHASAGYRAQLVRTLTARALRQAMATAEGGP
jgi:carbon-monoxide dehydrogenase medium subunit